MNEVVTDEMLDAAVKKAVEGGLLPRHVCREDASGYRELIRYVVQAALDAAPSRGITPRRGAKLDGAMFDLPGQGADSGADVPATGLWSGTGSWSGGGFWSGMGSSAGTGSGGT